jgi:hypothetical protein
MHQARKDNLIQNDWHTRPQIETGYVYVRENRVRIRLTEEEWAPEKFLARKQF